MRFSVGYQLTENGSWSNYIIEQKDAVNEVYFPWNGYASGREEATPPDGMSVLDAQINKRDELRAIRASGIKLNLLLNGNCYGDDSLSRVFFLSLGTLLDELIEDPGISSVTTSSPVIAKFIRDNFEDLEIRASVNMEIGSADGMDYLADRFDGYYMKREYNRDFAQIRRLKAWCDAHGKKLFMLANSGCLNNCSAHHFHDDLVAHHAGISKRDNAYDFQGICWDYLKDKKHLDTYLQQTNFVRPEDIHLYEEWFDTVKLATRSTKHPERTLRAYVSGRYIGSVMDILEPNHSGAAYPALIENSAVPADFINTVGNCDKNCESCGYCRRILRKSLICMEELPNVDE